MQAPSIHDNRVISYEVDGECRRIVLHTRFGEGDHVEYADLVFEGVLAYHFENDNFGNVLFGIAEVSVPRLVQRNRSLFDDGSKNAWPGPWNESPESAVLHLESNGAKAFEISSSYGLCGWIVAGSYRLEPARGRAL